VQPEIHIFGLTLQSFGLMMGLGFVVAGICVTRHVQELGKPSDWGYEIVFASLVGGLVGARLWWIGENWSDAKDDLLGSLFSGTGLVWYGGAFGGAVAVLAWAAWRRWFTLSMLDATAVPLAAGYAIGRIGCQLSGDGDYGIPWDGPWAMAYPHGTVPTTETVHPTPVYETLTMILVAWWLWRHRHAWRPGTVFAARAHAAAADLGGDDDRRRRVAALAQASARRSQRRASPCSSASCCTERWWPPGTMTSLA
jgi:phosphatidylglycerol:prolipoprotein diacylglycerol transferase